MFLSNGAIKREGDQMHKALPIILLFLIVVFSGCTGSDSSDELASVQTQFERANLNLDGKIVDVKLVPGDVRAGEKVTAELVIANTGTENITKETIDIKAKVKTLNDTMANLALKFMDDEKKIRSFTMDFDEEIKPGTVKAISAIFNTQQEMQGRSLAGTYQITITLSVNGQKVDAKLLPVTLHSGTPRAFTPTPTPPPTPASTSAIIPTIIATETPTPTPTPTPEPVVTATPTGVKIPLRVMANKFTEPNKNIDVGDAIIWTNYDTEERYTLVEVNGKIGNMTLSDRVTYVFNTTGSYRFLLQYYQMREPYSYQDITVKVNTSQ